MAKMSVSVVKGHGSMAHNNREFSTQNVDKNKTPDNITYKAEPIEKAYQKLFAEEVERYNVGKKPSRQIPDYMEHIRQSKNGEKLFYETVVQVGNKFDCPVGSDMGEKAKSVLNDYMKDFQERNPNLYVFNAVLHLDESTPHLHIDYIPVAHGYEKGLQVRNSLDKALKEQGVEGKANKRENSTHNWQEGEKDRLEGIMREYGLERSSEKGLHREHMTVDQYKAVAEQVHNEVKELPKQIETAPVLLNKNRVSVEKADLESLEQRAKLSMVHEKATKTLEQSITKTKDDSTQYITNKMSLALMEHGNAEKEYDKARSERLKAEELKAKYENLYKNQSVLNDNYKKLYSAYKGQQETIQNLQTENTSLRGQIADLRQSIEEKVKQAVEPLKEQIQGFIDKIKGMATTTKSITNAVAYIDKHFESEKLHKICEAVKDYSKEWLKEDGFSDMAKEVGVPELSKGISKRLIPEYREIIYRKGDLGYGFYAAKEEGGQFLGEKKDYAALRQTFPDAKFKDPFEHIPQISGHGRSL